MDADRGHLVGVEVVFVRLLHCEVSLSLPSLLSSGRRSLRSRALVHFHTGIYVGCLEFGCTDVSACPDLASHFSHFCQGGRMGIDSTLWTPVRHCCICCSVTPALWGVPFCPSPCGVFGGFLLERSRPFWHHRCSRPILRVSCPILESAFLQESWFLLVENGARHELGAWWPPHFLVLAIQKQKLLIAFLEREEGERQRQTGRHTELLFRPSAHSLAESA